VDESRNIADIVEREVERVVSGLIAGPAVSL
jgi:hypothetical protein